MCADMRISFVCRLNVPQNISKPFWSDFLDEKKCSKFELFKRQNWLCNMKGIKLWELKIFKAENFLRLCLKNFMIILYHEMLIMKICVICKIPILWKVLKNTKILFCKTIKNKNLNQDFKSKISLQAMNILFNGNRNKNLN